jgi:hypothetical protein
LIEEITPQVVTLSLLLVTVSAAILTLVLSAFLLWLYRRAVTREMGLARDVHASLAATTRPADRKRPLRTDAAGFLVWVWIYVWPMVLALGLIVPRPLRWWAACAGVYVVVFTILGLWAATITDMPEFRFGGVVLPARSAVMPSGMATLWLAVNAAPTVLVWGSASTAASAPSPRLCWRSATEEAMRS